MWDACADLGQPAGRLPETMNTFKIKTESRCLFFYSFAKKTGAAMYDTGAYTYDSVVRLILHIFHQHS